MTGLPCEENRSVRARTGEVEGKGGRKEERRGEESYDCLAPKDKVGRRITGSASAVEAAGKETHQYLSRREEEEGKLLTSRRKCKP
jgi:hypothetical protein